MEMREQETRLMTPGEAHADLLAEIAALREHVASLDRRIAELQGALGQTSDQQTATSEILRVISSSRTDVQPVFDAIVESAHRLCGAHFTAVHPFDGELVHPAAAMRNFDPMGAEAMTKQFPMKTDPAQRDRAGDPQPTPKLCARRAGRPRLRGNAAWRSSPDRGLREHSGSPDAARGAA